MKKVSLLLIFCLGAMFSGCSNKQLAAADTKTADVNKTESQSKQQAVKEVNKTIKRTNVTINSYSDCPSFTTSDYKTIPYE